MAIARVHSLIQAKHEKEKTWHGTLEAFNKLRINLYLQTFWAIYWIAAAYYLPTPAYKRQISFTVLGKKLPRPSKRDNSAAIQYEKRKSKL